MIKVPEYKQRYMKKSTGTILLFICIAAILIAGCTSQPAPAAVTTTAATPAPTTTAPVQTPVPIAETTTQDPVVTSATPAIIVVVTTAYPTTDPILHRWVREIFQTVNGVKVGYEFKFYPDGTVGYKYGPTEEVSSNLRILTPDASLGTWTKLEDNKYLVKVPLGDGSIMREYTLVPAHENPGYKGITIPTHIESIYETDAIGKAHVQSYGEMYYPEQAKID
jgi:hypothetical protein